VIAGEGATYEACRSIAERAGLADKIVHVGKVPHHQIQALYSIVDILAYPRDSQRITELVTPLKPLEALAMEKAVVASDVGGLTELIEDERTGLICRHEDPADLAAKIARLADDPALRARLGKTGRDQVIKTREWRKIIESHFEVYQRAEENWSKNRLVWKGLARMMDLAPSQKEW
jgi:glycosyltransferase involved in cell wall biosynthesis